MNLSVEFFWSKSFHWLSITRARWRDCCWRRREMVPEGRKFRPKNQSATAQGWGEARASSARLASYAYLLSTCVLFSNNFRLQHTHDGWRECDELLTWVTTTTMQMERETQGGGVEVSIGETTNIFLRNVKLYRFFRRREVFHYSSTVDGKSDKLENNLETFFFLVYHEKLSFSRIQSM